MTINQIKAVGKSGTQFKMTAKCTFTSMEPVIPADGATISIELDKPTTKFSSKQVSVLTTDDTSYRVTNSKQITKKKFVITFSVQFDAPPFCFPVGTCKTIEETTSTTTTSTTSTSTTTEATTTESGFGDIEYLQNNDMESSFTGNWNCYPDCTLEPSTDSYTGTQSAKISNRNENWKGLSQPVSLTPGLRYSLSGFLKLLNTENNAMFHAADVVLVCTNNKGKNVTIKFGNYKMIQPGIWTELGAIIKIPADITTVAVSVVMDGLADYVADSFSLREVPDIVDWRAEAEARIEQIRKADISISVKSSQPLPANVSIEVEQIRHEFPFGSAVSPDAILDTENPVLKNYRDFFYEHFNWGMPINSLKWKQTERVQGEFDCTLAWNAVNELRDHGIKVRGHSIFFAHEKNQPGWVLDLSPQELKDAIYTRVDDLVGNFTGLIEHWVVNNENTHGIFYESRSGDANITMKMFEAVHAKDPNAKLFLNDFEVIETRNRQKATAITYQAKLFKEAGIPIHGLALQSHLKNWDLDITAMKERLDKVAEAGLSVYVSEFSIEEWNETLKAQALKDALTLYFSHPAVDGIVIWGFWEGIIFAKSAKLVEGEDMTPNAAGEALITLLKQTWRTVETRDIVAENPVIIRGFKGDYTVILKHGDTVLGSRNFTLGDSGAVVEIDLS